MKIVLDTTLEALSEVILNSSNPTIVAAILAGTYVEPVITPKENKRFIGYDKWTNRVSYAIFKTRWYSNPSCVGEYKPYKTGDFIYSLISSDEEIIYCKLEDWNDYKDAVINSHVD